MKNRTEDKISNESLLNRAFLLSLITIFYNIAEGLVSVYFGISDDTIALAGFGFDSFVEVLSGIAVGHMVWRMKFATVRDNDRFEKTALYITGTAFFLLVAGIIAGSAINIITDTAPETTIPGVIISSISIFTMYFLYRIKLKTGIALESDAIISDSYCTKTCFYLSFVLLASSLLYEFFKISYIDIAGGAVVAYFAFREGKEAFEKAKTGKGCCSCGSKKC